MNQHNYFLRKNDNCAYQVIEGEAVIVRLLPGGASRVLSLNRVGTEVWRLADGRMSLAGIGQQLAEQFKLDIAEVLGDVISFAQDLEVRGLASIESRGPTSA